MDALEKVSMGSKRIRSRSNQSSEKSTRLAVVARERRAFVSGQQRRHMNANILCLSWREKLLKMKNIENAQRYEYVVGVEGGGVERNFPTANSAKLRKSQECVR
jgi:hypothetical protein